MGPAVAEADCIAQLGGWAGYSVTSWRHEQRGDRRWLVLDLAPAPRSEHRCSGCSQVVTSIHDRTLRCIRDLPVFEDPVELRVPRLRLACPRCGPRLEQLDWLDPQHGNRAGDFCSKLFKDGVLRLSGDELELLVMACQGHSDGLREAHPTVQTCWDADRLDLGRVGVRPDPR